ncbi:MAG: hypothetical protein QXG00_00040 [Candidatus Woesearchaeota archaeon]
MWSKKSKDYNESLNKLEELKKRAEEKIINKFSELENLISIAKETKRRLDQIKIEFIEQINNTNKEIKRDVEKSNQISNAFRTIYGKYCEIINLLKEIQADTGYMEVELNHIIRKEAIISSHTDISEQIKKTEEIKLMYDEVKKKKQEFEDYLERVNNIVEEILKNR